MNEELSASCATSAYKNSRSWLGVCVTKISASKNSAKNFSAILHYSFIRFREHLLLFVLTIHILYKILLYTYINMLAILYNVCGWYFPVPLWRLHWYVQFTLFYTIYYSFEPGAKPEFRIGGYSAHNYSRKIFI